MRRALDLGTIVGAARENIQPLGQPRLQRPGEVHARVLAAGQRQVDVRSGQAVDRRAILSDSVRRAVQVLARDFSVFAIDRMPEPAAERLDLGPPLSVLAGTEGVLLQKRR